MLNFNFSEKGLASPPHSVYHFFKKNVSHAVVLTNQILLSECLYFSRYWAICVSQLFVNQAVTLQILKLTLSF